MSEKRAFTIMKNKRRKLNIHYSAGILVRFLILTLIMLFILISLLPFYYMLINSISKEPVYDIYYNQIRPVTFIPKGIEFKRYLELLGFQEFVKAFQVTTARTIIGTIIMVLAASFIGYLITKKEMWGGKYWLRFFTITLYANAGLISWYFNMYMLGLTDNFLGYILPGIVAPINILLVKNYVKSIPTELEESAMIDGAGYLTRYRKIIFPLCKPILMTVALFSALYHWNSFVDSFVLMRTDHDLFSLQFFLYKYSQGSNVLFQSMMQLSFAPQMVEQGYLFGSKGIYTIVMVITIPIFIIFLLFQRYFIKGIEFRKMKE